MRRDVVNLFALTAALAVATAIAGWWTIPIVAAAWTILSPRRGAVLYAGLAGAMSWGALFVWYAQRGAAIGSADALMAAVLGVPARSVLSLAMVYAALLAGAAALVAQSFRPILSPRSRSG